MMKRIVAFVTLLFVLSIFGACVHTGEPPVKAPVSVGIDAIVKRGELIVGTAGSMPPLNMTTKSGKVIGLEPDIASIMAGAMGVKLKLATMPFVELLSALERGDVDMVMSSMTMTPKRNMEVAFVGPYFISGKSILTKTNTIEAAANTEDINTPDTSLTALKGSTSQVFVEKLLPKTQLVLARDYDAAVAMVVDGKVDAMVADYPICVISVLRYPEEGLASLAKPLTIEPIGVALPGNDPLLLNWVQNFLGMLEKSGELEALREKWFEAGSWLQELP
jgi:polar amino acid transport system substrate-binding protein